LPKHKWTNVMTDRDLVTQAMSEAQRLNAAQGPTSFESPPTMQTLREVLEPKPQQKALPDRPTPPMAELDLDTAIRLRWTLRDIKSSRLKLVSPRDLATLTAMGLVEVRDDRPSLTNAGVRAID
jgi:hypothetical protein